MWKLFSLTLGRSFYLRFFNPTAHSVLSPSVFFVFSLKTSIAHVHARSSSIFLLSHNTVGDLSGDPQTAVRALLVSSLRLSFILKTGIQTYYVPFQLTRGHLKRTHSREQLRQHTVRPNTHQCQRKCWYTNQHTPKERRYTVFP